MTKDETKVIKVKGKGIQEHDSNFNEISSQKPKINGQELKEWATKSGMTYSLLGGKHRYKCKLICLSVSSTGRL